MTAAGWQSIWSSRGPMACLLWPVSQLYRSLAALDRALYRMGVRRVEPSRLPVLVVGNIGVGGTGKSPLTAWLCEQLAAAGLRPGIVSRGYGGSHAGAAHRVSDHDEASVVGDEPLMLAHMTGVPVSVCRRRAEAVEQLASSGEVDVVVSDDGLQHHAMARDIEIVVVDAVTGFGNGWLLPAGPLRESTDRLDSVDLVVYQCGAGMDAPTSRASFELALTNCRSLTSGTSERVTRFAGQRVHAVAAIGRPARFFDALRSVGIDVIEHPLPDHHPITPEDVAFDDPMPVLVTQKDAIKLQSIHSPLDKVYTVETRLQPSTQLRDACDQLVDQLRMQMQQERTP